MQAFDLLIQGLPPLTEPQEHVEAIRHDIRLKRRAKAKPIVIGETLSAPEGANA